MSNWEHEVYREFASNWSFDDELEKEVEAWKARIIHGIDFSEDDWNRGKEYSDNGWLSLSAYDGDAEDHVGPIRFDINMNDSFCYACAWGTSVPQAKLEAVFSACEAKDAGLLSSIAADIEGLPPVNEIIDSMEKSGTVPAEKIAHYRKQMEAAGRKDERW